AETGRPGWSRADEAGLEDVVIRLDLDADREAGEAHSADRVRAGAGHAQARTGKGADFDQRRAGITRLRRPVESRPAGKRRQEGERRDHEGTRSRDVEIDRVGAGVRVRVEDRLPQ